MSYGLGKQKPNCPKCNSNRNIVEHLTYYRCSFCGEKIKKEGQATLI